MYNHVFISNRNVLFYLLNTGIANLGTVLSHLAFLFLANEPTESRIYTTVIAISQVIPILLFGLIGGVIADWINNKGYSFSFIYSHTASFLPGALYQINLLNY